MYIKDYPTILEPHAQGSISHQHICIFLDRPDWTGSNRTGLDFGRSEWHLVSYNSYVLKLEELQLLELQQEDIKDSLRILMEIGMDFLVWSSLWIL